MFNINKILLPSQKCSINRLWARLLLIDRHTCFQKKTTKVLR